jgi:isopenicillin-N N-acyltransferase-like protein
MVEFRYPECKAQGGHLTYHGDIPVLEVGGAGAQVGRQIGELAVRPAARLLDYPRDLLRSKFRLPGLANLLMALLKRPSRRLYSNIPDRFREEIEAIASCRLDRGKLIAANTLFDFSHAGLKPLFGCSSLIIPPAHSSSGTMLLGRNLDFFDLGYLHDYSLVTVRQPGPDRLGYLDVGFPGSVGCFSGMNEVGLAVVRHEVLRPKIPAKFDLAGMPFASMLRTVMETCRNVSSSIEVLTRTHHASPGIVVVTDPSSAAIVETTPRGVRVRDASTVVTGCTNHFLDPTLANPDQPNDYRTLDRLRSLSESAGQTRDPDGVWKRLHAVHQNEMTIQSMVFEPAERAVHVAFGPGPTTGRRPVRLSFSDLFPNRHGQWIPTADRKVSCPDHASVSNCTTSEMA